MLVAAFAPVEVSPARATTAATMRWLKDLWSVWDLAELGGMLLFIFGAAWANTGPAAGRSH